MTTDKVYIILVNWNGWKDTIECLESVFRNHYQSYQVIVCDNASENDSLDKIKQWAEGSIQANCHDSRSVSQYTNPPIEKPIKYVEYDRRQAEQGGGQADSEFKLILIQTGANLGFAGGNNVGIRYALARDDSEYLWLLNNDTVIAPDALIHLMTKAKEQPNTGICGSTLLFYYQPGVVQAFGGAKYNTWLGLTRSIGAFCQWPYTRQIDNNLDFISGASMLVPKSFVKEIGLMSENYFLYYEEIDWATRAKGRYILAHAPNSIVYHKEGASTGGDSTNIKRRTFLSDYYGLCNKILFTKKFYPYKLWSIYLSLILSIINRIQRKQWDRVVMILKIIVKNS